MCEHKRERGHHKFLHGAATGIPAPIGSELSAQYDLVSAGREYRQRGAARSTAADSLIDLPPVPARPNAVD